MCHETGLNPEPRGWKVSSSSHCYPYMTFNMHHLHTIIDISFIFVLVYLLYPTTTSLQKQTTKSSLAVYIVPEILFYFVIPFPVSIIRLWPDHGYFIARDFKLEYFYCLICYKVIGIKTIESNVNLNWIWTECGLDNIPYDLSSDHVQPILW